MKRKNNKKISVDNFDLEELYSYEDTIDDHLENLRDKSITHYRTKTIKSGKVLEVEIYPIWNTKNAIRKAKQTISRDSQKRLNDKNAVKKAIRLINSNFTDKDIWTTFTYSNTKIPNSYKEALKNMQNYIRRLKYLNKQRGYPTLKYFYVTEYSNKKNKIRVHHHLVTNFPNRDLAEKLWHGGARTQSRRLQADEFGYEGLTRYLMKNPQGAKKYICSKNLSKPIIYIADRKISKRRANLIATNQIDAKIILEKIYKKYQLQDYKAKTSPYVSGAYIYARLKLRI